MTESARSWRWPWRLSSGAWIGWAVRRGIGGGWRSKGGDVSEPWTAVFVAGIVFLVVGAGSGILVGLLKRRATDLAERAEREMFWNAIRPLSDTLAAMPGSRMARADWERVLTGFYSGGFTLNDTQRIIRLFVSIFGSVAWDCKDFLARKNAWSIQTFGPGDAADRVEGLIDHIQKELDELRAAPMDVEEWADVAFLALDGAFRAGAGPDLIAVALEGKLAKNQARAWPDWRTAEPGKAIEHVRSGDPT